MDVIETDLTLIDQRWVITDIQTATSSVAVSYMSDRRRKSSMPQMSGQHAPHFSLPHIFFRDCINILSEEKK